MARSADLNWRWPAYCNTPLLGLPNGDGDWYPYVDCTESVVLRDRMITEASLPIKSEHSYCNVDLPAVTVKEEIDDMESECFPAISMSTATGGGDGDPEMVSVLRRPASPPASPPALTRQVTPTGAQQGRSQPAGSVLQPVTRKLVLAQPRPGVQLVRRTGATVQTIQQASAGQSVLRPQTILVTTSRPAVASSGATVLQDSTASPRLSVKLEPNTAFSLPPTPPSSDSDGGASPTRGGCLVSPLRPVTQRTPKVVVTPGRPPSRLPGTASLISTHLQKSSGGVLYLTEEEKRTLVAEGYNVPSRFPLSKAEERSLKKIRRKIKNKISAQESRRKKKEYMDQLEQRLDLAAAENDRYQARLAELESQHRQLDQRNGQLEQRNSLLQRQLAQLQLLLSGGTEKLKEDSTLPLKNGSVLVKAEN